MVGIGVGWEGGAAAQVTDVCTSYCISEINLLWISDLQIVARSAMPYNVPPSLGSAIAHACIIACIFNRPQPTAARGTFPHRVHMILSTSVVTASALERETHLPSLSRRQSTDCSASSTCDRARLSRSTIDLISMTWTRRFHCIFRLHVLHVYYAQVPRHSPK